MSITVDQGRHWERGELFSPIEAAGQGVVLSSTGDTILVTLFGSVGRSIDGGRAWNPTSLGRRAVTALLSDPMHPGTVYAGDGADATSMRCQRSTDWGLTWSDAFPPRAGISRVTCMALAFLDSEDGISYARRALFLGTRSDGVWMAELDDAPVAIEHPSGAQEFSLRISPNPVRGDAIATIEHDGAHSLRVEVVDMLRKLVTWRVLGDLAPGTTSVPLPTMGLVPASYLCFVRSGTSMRGAVFQVLR